MKILSNRTTDFGLNNAYNAARFVTSVEKPDSDLQEKFISEYNIFYTSSLYNPLRYMIQDFLFEGAWSEMPIDDYRIGFKTDIAAKINEGMLYDLGDVYSVSPNVTPVFNDQLGHIST